ncbi:MAG: helix-turn-helix domain-containing protein [Actinobacteria bacterium]|nr:helix-turn-helix domain-containing protein [Actinomycetota bacterium]
MTVYGERIADVSTALADPTRREIMDFVIRSESPLSVREVARHFGLHDNAARLHLDKLVKGGLLRVVRSRQKRGGRPAHLYRPGDGDWELSVPPRQYRLLAEIMVRAVSRAGGGASRRAEEEAFALGREEAARAGSPLARLSQGCPLSALKEAWEEEMRRRGMRSRIAELPPGNLVVTFLGCPFGDIPGEGRDFVCEVHRRLEEGFLSMAGDYRLERGESRCAFRLSVLDASRP